MRCLGHTISCNFSKFWNSKFYSHKSRFSLAWKTCEKSFSKRDYCRKRLSQTTKFSTWAWRISAKICNWNRSHRLQCNQVDCLELYITCVIEKPQSNWELLERSAIFLVPSLMRGQTKTNKVGSGRKIKQVYFEKREYFVVIINTTQKYTFLCLENSQVQVFCWLIKNWKNKNQCDFIFLWAEKCFAL